MQIYNTVLSTVPQNICFLGMTDKSKVHVPRYLQAVSAMRERNISVLGHGKIFFTVELTLFPAGFKHCSSETAHPKTEDAFRLKANKFQM